MIITRSSALYIFFIEWKIISKTIDILDPAATKMNAGANVDGQSISR